MSAEVLTREERTVAAHCAAVSKAAPFAPWDYLARYEATVQAAITRAEAAEERAGASRSALEHTRKCRDTSLCEFCTVEVEKAIAADDAAREAAS